SPQAGEGPEAKLHSPWSDRDSGLDSRIDRVPIGGVCRAAFREKMIRRRAPERLAGCAEPAANRVDRAVAAHRVADNSGPARVDQAAMELGRLGRARQPIDLSQNEQ